MRSRAATGKECRRRHRNGGQKFECLRCGGLHLPLPEKPMLSGPTDGAEGEARQQYLGEHRHE